MKTVFCSAMITLGLLAGCSDASQNSDSQQTVLVYANYSDYYYGDDDEVELPNTSIEGIIAGSPLPAFKSVRIGSQLFSDIPAATRPGYLAFPDYDLFDETSPLMVTVGFSPLAVTVETSEGSVAGSVDRPSLIQSITTSASSLSIGQPLTLQWTGGSADFTYVYAEFEWRDEYGDWYDQSLDTLVTGNSVIFPGSHFDRDGEFTIYGVDPVNGPKPEPGARGNMSGDGSGFLYYVREDQPDAYMNITVGSGMYGKALPKKVSRKTVRQRLDQGIRKKLELTD